MNNNDGFVVLNDGKGRPTRVNDLKELEAFLFTYNGEALAQLVWASLKDTFRIGKNVGKKQAWEEASAQHGFENPYAR